MTRISDYLKEDVCLGEKVQEAHDLLWNRARGEGHEKLAKAESDYAKAENDRIEAELRRRTFEARTRHATADATKAEHEAELAELKIIEARLDLIAKAKAIGVSLQMDGSKRIIITPLLAVEQIQQPSLAAVVDEEAPGAIREILLDRGCGKYFIDWHVKPGSKVPPNYEIGTVSCRPEYDPPESKTTGAVFSIKSVFAGQILELCKHTGDRLREGAVVARMFCSQPQRKSAQF